MGLKDVKIDEVVDKRETNIKRAVDPVKKEEKTDSLSGLGIGTINLDAIQGEETKPETEQMTLYLKKELADKLKTVGGSKNVTITKLVEMVLDETFAGIEANEEAINKYNENFKRKSYSPRKNRKK